MSGRDLGLSPLKAPPGLMQAVAHKGSLLIQETRPRASRAKRVKLMTDVGLTLFCIGHLAWCAHAIGFLL